VVPSEGGEPIRLTDHPAFDWGPTWSPDGDRIIFTSDRGGEAALYRVANAGGEAEPFLDVDGGIYVPTYSPSGEWIVFETGPEGDRDIARIRPDGSEFTLLTSDPGTDLAPSWSPDGDLIAFASDRSGDLDVYLMASDGSGQRNITQHPGANEGWGGTTWSPDQAQIVTNQSGHTPFWAEPFVREALGVAGYWSRPVSSPGSCLWLFVTEPSPSDLSRS
jgi:TolB protein